jgi:hypothetical protein
MKKNYIKLFAAITSALLLNSNAVNAQCITPPATTISAAGTCGPLPFSATLSATGVSSLQTGWYTNAFGGNAVGTGSTYATPSLTAPTVYYTAQLAPTTSQSLTLPAQSSPYVGDTRGFWFAAPTSFVIKGVRVPTDNVGNSSIAIVKIPSIPPAYPAFTNTFSVLYLAQNVPGTGTISVNIPVYSGDVIGVLGVRSNINSYGPGGYVANLGTNTLTLNRFGMQFPLSTTAPQDLWDGGASSISRVELYTTLGCLNSLTAYTVNTSPSPTVTAVSNTSLLCSGQSATVTPSGAVSYTFFPAIPMSGVISPTTTTSYTVLGVSAAGCTGLGSFTQSVTACTGLEANANNQLSLALYPNPTTGIFTIELTNGLTKNIQITDITGRVVINQTTNEDLINLNVSNLANGVYYVKVLSNGESEVMKIVKQ